VKVSRADLSEILIIEPRVFSDDRGFFLESFNERVFAEAGLPTHFRQDNWSRSSRSVLRGLHYQLDHPQGKLVMCVRGEVFDAVVDIRRGSPTFGRWVATTLREDAPRAIWIPPGFAHGFCVLSDTADILYKCTELYYSDDQRGVQWNDPSIGVPWPITSPRISTKDLQYLPLNSSRDDLPRF
jgi:dTDP-4-dehydrorhamnose 3,5-epimerase